MKKRLRKKEYKAAIAAKNLLDNWTGDLYVGIILGYFDPNTRNSREGKMIRRAISLRGLDQTGSGWTLMLPKTEEMMKELWKTPNYRINLYGHMFDEHGECIGTCFHVDLRKLTEDRQYAHLISRSPKYPMVADFFQSLNEALRRY